MDMAARVSLRARRHTAFVFDLPGDPTVKTPVKSAKNWRRFGPFLTDVSVIGTIRFGCDHGAAHEDRGGNGRRGHRGRQGGGAGIRGRSVRAVDGADAARR